jgi:catechol 1,2-dioxygenase
MNDATLRGFNEDNATEAVLARMDQCDNPRLKQVMSSIISHLHAVVKEVEPTQAEWMQAIEFLTETGRWCDGKRQEFILMSDTLGVSMLVDAINNRKPSGATESTVLGPFHVAGAEVMENGTNISKQERGAPCFVSCRVLDMDGKPVAGAKIDLWHARDDGFYDVQLPGDEMDLRGIFATDADGRFYFQTILPCYYPVPTDGPVGRMLKGLGRHPFRPAHIHFIISAAGYEPVTTHLFVQGDPYLDSDAVFGVKDSLIKQFERHDDAAEAARRGVKAPFYAVEHDFKLAPAEAASQAA